MLFLIHSGPYGGMQRCRWTLEVTSMSQLLLIISDITLEIFSPCWGASLDAINSASQVDLAIRSCLLDRH